MKAAVTAPVELPNFRNKGVILRMVLIAEGASLIAAYAYQPRVEGFLTDYVMQRQLFEPALLLSTLFLFVMAPRLMAMRYRNGVLVAVGLVLLATSLVHMAIQALFPTGLTQPLHQSLILCLATCVPVLGYFNWRHRALSPALVEARLMALQSRIRPHFLFNSLNTVLSLIRAEPRRAEQMLENLAELYRALLSEASTLVPLSRELEIAQAYAEIEAIRLGARLSVNWQCQGAPGDALIPPLTLQPLLENAVNHGVEPAPKGGMVSVTAFLKGDQLNLVVRNPILRSVARRPGNRIALANIRERLALHFDAEAEMSAYESGDEYVVQIRLPYQHAQCAERPAGR
ncbi:MAG: sensor histidine kinase [Pseudomonadota bacterium]